MGKNLKGKECGKGICQRKDGLYCSRFVDKLGKRHEKYFQTLPEARNWLDSSRMGIELNNTTNTSNMTVDEWFEYWINNIVCDLAPNTRRNYCERYKQNIQPVIGAMQLSDVKPLHCKSVLNKMDEKYAGSTIRQTYILGHASIQTTMDRYVHVTDDSMLKAVEQFENAKYKMV